MKETKKQFILSCLPILKLMIDLLFHSELAQKCCFQNLDERDLWEYTGLRKQKKHQTNLQFSKPSQVAKGCETNRKDHVGSALESVAQEHVLNSNHLRFSHVKQPFPIHTMTRSKLNHTTLHLILIKLNAHELQGETGFSTPKNVIKCGI